MRTWWLSLIDSLRSSFWFVPTLMAAGGLILAGGLLMVDAATSVADWRGFGWLDAGDAQTVRSLLASFLGAVITVMTVVFSVTIVALQLASTQFGPRLLRTFMQNRGTHFSLGAFVGIGVYCATVLGAVGRFQLKDHVPHLASLGALLLAIGSLGVLVYFIHHTARSIQAPEVIASVAKEIDLAIARWYPAGGIEPIKPHPRPLPPVEEATQITARRPGYVQSIDLDALVAMATRRDLQLRLRCRAGDFVVGGEVFADAWPREAVDAAVDQTVGDAFTLGTHRTPTQDVEFAIDQLVEIAVRAMSPAINDPFTAMNCIDRLSHGLSRLARCRMDVADHVDADGTLRVLEVAPTYQGAVDAAFNQIRQTARNHPSVMMRLLEAIRVVAHHTTEDRQRQALRRHAEMIHRATGEAFSEPEDRRDADERYEQAVAALRSAAQQGHARPSADGEPAALRAVRTEVEVSSSD